MGSSVNVCFSVPYLRHTSSTMQRPTWLGIGLGLGLGPTRYPNSRPTYVTNSNNIHLTKRHRVCMGCMNMYGGILWVKHWVWGFRGIPSAFSVGGYGNWNPITASALSVLRYVIYLLWAKCLVTNMCVLFSRFFHISACCFLLLFHVITRSDENKVHSFIHLLRACPIIITVLQWLADFPWSTPDLWLRCNHFRVKYRL